MNLQTLIEQTLRQARPIQDMPRRQWGLARGIWTGRLSQEELFPYLPDDGVPIDLVWIAENPGEWDRAERPELYTAEQFNWKAYLDHFGANQEIPHWRAVRKALGQICGSRRTRILFSNAYLFEWAGGKKAHGPDVSRSFAATQGPLFTALLESGGLAKEACACLSGHYAQAAWTHAQSMFPALSELKAVPVGHPSRGHLAQSMRDFKP